LSCEGAIHRLEGGIHYWPAWTAKPNAGGPAEFDLAISVDQTYRVRAHRVDRDPDTERVVLGVESVKAQTTPFGLKDDEIGGDIVTVGDRDDVRPIQNATMPVTESSAGMVTVGGSPASAGSG
jgi:hypothetical protein